MTTPVWAAALAARRRDPLLTLSQIGEQIGRTPETVSRHLKDAELAGEPVPDAVVARRLGPGQYKALRAVAAGHVADRCNERGFWTIRRTDGPAGAAGQNITRVVRSLWRQRLVERDTSPGQVGGAAWRVTGKGRVILGWMQATYGAGPWGGWNDGTRDGHTYVIKPVSGQDAYVGWQGGDAAWCGTRAQALDNGVSPAVLARADARGSSSRSMLGYGAGQIRTPSGPVARADLAEYARLRCSGVGPPERKEP